MAKTVRRIAATLLGVGESRIWIDPENMQKVGEALTRDDVRKLIADGIIKAQPSMGVSRARGRKKQEGKRKGRRRGHGSRKGTANARQPGKKLWMARVRLQRKTLAAIRDKGEIETSASRKVYSMIKGGAFKGKASLMTYLKENKLIKG